MSFIAAILTSISLTPKAELCYSCFGKWVKPQSTMTFAANEEKVVRVHRFLSSHHIDCILFGKQKNSFIIYAHTNSDDYLKCLFFALRKHTYAFLNLNTMLFFLAKRGSNKECIPCYRHKFFLVTHQ
ncbi:hypothetical protein PanWU01x14_076740 [Parasponia andersonii]|uniref:Uncharacterized protein n=1 Tax=Parasponia andersonii TaxID=3476 RepID=A0A2P5DCD8_PARAD|nr:hypothetical protein PanWU01x14_076740 [Parasponia andersonii]